MYLFIYFSPPSRKYIFKGVLHEFTNNIFLSKWDGGTRDLIEKNKKKISKVGGKGRMVNMVFQRMTSVYNVLFLLYKKTSRSFTPS